MTKFYHVYSKRTKLQLKLKDHYENCVWISRTYGLFVMNDK